MINKISFAILCCFLSFQTFGQRVLNEVNGELNFGAIESWPSLNSQERARTTYDGQYFLYSIYNQPEKNKTFTVRSIKGSWQESFVGFSFLDMPLKTDLVLLKKGVDSILILDLKTKQKEYLFTKNPMVKGSFLLYNDSTGNVILRDLKTGLKNVYPAKTKISFSDDGLHYVLIEPKAGVFEYKLFFTATKIGKKFHSDVTSGEIIFDKSHKQLLLTTEADKKVWLYSFGDSSSKMITSGKEIAMANSGAVFDRSVSINGDKIIFQVTLPLIKPQKDSNTDVKVWSYNSTIVPNFDFGTIDNRLERPATTRVVWSLHKGYVGIVPVFNLKKASSYKDSILLIYSSELNDSVDAFTLYSMIDGKKIKTINIKATSVHGLPQFSSDGKYLIFYDKSKYNWFSYSLHDDKLINITGDAGTVWNNFESEILSERDKPKGDPLLEFNREKLLLKDAYGDIWELDLKKETNPRSLTLGFAKSKHLDFEIINASGLSNSLIKHPKIILSFFNLISKQRGFYELDYKSLDLVLLSQGGYHDVTNVRGYGRNLVFFGRERDFPVLSVANGGFIFALSKSYASLNWFYTKDFKDFKQLSFLKPEDGFNWYTTELIEWNLPSGKVNQGVLYRPKHLETGRKYPVIIDTYEIASDGLNIFRIPRLSTGEIDIPWFVSRGYLVFTPDIHFEIGNPGKSLQETISSGVDVITKISYVNPDKLGIAGHSFGGWSSSLMATRDTRFKAVLSSAGVNNLVSNFAQLRGIGTNQDYFESGQGRMGKSLLSNLDNYILNSPIFKLDKVSAPVLVHANRKDPNVPFAQGIELFLGLKTLGKPTWLLEYENGNHSLRAISESKDYTIRITQFFDHYLKDFPAPKWLRLENNSSLEFTDGFQ